MVGLYTRTPHHKAHPPSYFFISLGGLFLCFCCILGYFLNIGHYSLSSSTNTLNRRQWQKITLLPLLFGNFVCFSLIDWGLQNILGRIEKIFGITP